jgi:sec-independent protein translocase protein TatA
MTPLATFGNLFSGDGIIIFLILLLLFGAKKLPELAKGLGSAVREFSKAKDEIHSEMTRAATPQPPQITAPKYTEPHLSGAPTDEYGHPLNEHDEHGYVVPPDPAPHVTTPAPAPTVASQPSVPVTGNPEVHPASTASTKVTEETAKQPSQVG